MSHLIAEETALHFIHHYQRLLVEVMAHPSFPKEDQQEALSYVAMLTKARSWMLQHPQVLEDALVALRSEGDAALAAKPKTQTKAKTQTAAKPPKPRQVKASHKAEGPLPADVEHAVRSMREGRWVYLRDTSQYSILLPIKAAAQPCAYAVKSLTTRLRDMTGTSGLVIQAALMEYAGRIVTDGLIGRVAYLGSNYCASYGDEVAQARAEGRFYKQQLLPAQEPAKDKAPAFVQPLHRSTPTLAVKARSKKTKNT